MTDEIKEFIKLLNTRRYELNDEYDNTISSMHNYDASSFHSELSSAYKYYADKYFDEERFIDSVKRDYNIDMCDSDIKGTIFDAVLEFSEAVILLATLRGYIKYNNIELGDEDEE